MQCSKYSFRIMFCVFSTLLIYEYNQYGNAHSVIFESMHGSSIVFLAQ